MSVGTSISPSAADLATLLSRPAVRLAALRPRRSRLAPSSRGEGWGSVMEPVTDPEVIEAIEAEFMLSVYEARRLARRRLLGLDPPPPPNPAALAALRDERSRQAAPLGSDQVR